MEDIATAHGLDIEESAASRRHCQPALRIRAPRDRHVSAVRRRQHGRRMDALGARAVRFPVHHAAQRRRPRRRAAKTSSTRSSCRIRARSAMINGSTGANIRPEYRGGIGDGGRRRPEAVRGRGGTLITLGAASAFAIENFAVPVRELEARPDARSALRARHDPQHRGRHDAPGRLRHGSRDLRVLQQQPVLRAGRRLRVAAHDRRRALSERSTSSRRAGCGAKS